MKPLIPAKYLLAAALPVIIAAVLLHHYRQLSDTVYGFLFGLGITMTLLSLAKLIKGEKQV